MERETGLEPATFTLASGMHPLKTPNKINASIDSDSSLAPPLAPATQNSANSGILEALIQVLTTLPIAERQKLASLLMGKDKD